MTNKSELKVLFVQAKDYLDRMIKEEGWKPATIKNFYKIKKLLVEIDELLDGRL